MAVKSKANRAAKDPGPRTVTATKSRLKSTPAATTEKWDAFAIFTCCLDRSKNLLKLHEAAHGKQSKPEKYMSDAHRAAIILSVSALDAFVRTFFIERVRSILADQKAEIPASLKDQIKKLIKEDDLLEASRKNDLLERVEKAFRADFEKKSFQGKKVITEYMQMIGITDVFHVVAKNAKYNEESLCQSLEKYTKRRHNIAHRGDYDLSTNPPSEVVINKKDATDCIKIIEIIGTHINKLGVSK